MSVLNFPPYPARRMRLIFLSDMSNLKNGRNEKTGYTSDARRARHGDVELFV